MITQRRTLAVLGLLAIVVVGMAAGLAVGLTSGLFGPPRPTPPGALSHFEEAGIAFEYPADWRVFRHDMTTSFSDLIAQLSPIDIPPPCVTTTNGGGAVSIECQDRVRLEPNTLVVRIDTFFRPTGSILDGVPGADPTTVAGLPAWLHRKPIGANVALEWTIANPKRIDAGYTIGAMLRGPDLLRLETQVRSLIASLRYVPPVRPLPAVGDGGPALRDALAAHLAFNASEDPTYLCFPLEFGTTRIATITREPSGPPLPGPAEVTCSTRLERSPLELWRVVLEIEWPPEVRSEPWGSELYFTLDGEYAGGRTMAP